MDDNQLLAHIKEVTAREEKLYGRECLTDEDVLELHKMKTDLDQCWDYLRQRRSLRDAHENPDTARMRSPDMIKNYED